MKTAVASRIVFFTLSTFIALGVLDAVASQVVLR